MIHNTVTLTINNQEIEQRIKNLTNRLQKINGWTEQDILQFCLTALQDYFMPSILSLMEEHVEKLENEGSTH